MRDYSEDKLVEQPAIALFQSLGWKIIKCYHEKLGATGTLGRSSRTEVVLVRSLRAALERLNPGVSKDAVGMSSPVIAVRCPPPRRTVRCTSS